MARIKFANDGEGTGEYELTYNPVELDAPQANDEGLKNSIPTLDGESVTFTKYFDNRRGRMIWRGFPSDHAAFSAQLSVIEAYEGNVKYLKMEDVGVALSIYETYTKIKVIAVNRVIRSGAGLTYEIIELVWENAES